MDLTGTIRRNVTWRTRNTLVVQIVGISAAQEISDGRTEERGGVANSSSFFKIRRVSVVKMSANPENLSKEKLKSELKRRGIPYNNYQNKSYYVDLYRSTLTRYSPGTSSDGSGSPPKKVYQLVYSKCTPRTYIKSSFFFFSIVIIVNELQGRSIYVFLITTIQGT